jgi:predicted RNA-binding Zn-ribbon protein involved in translation (DUF1610 family)
MTCHACKGHFTVDEQSTHAVCPWCGATCTKGSR